jgi:hypothetical protein
MDDEALAFQRCIEFGEDSHRIATGIPGYDGDGAVHELIRDQWQQSLRV